jgi:hypothetical protein
MTKAATPQQSTANGEDTAITRGGLEPGSPNADGPQDAPSGGKRRGRKIDPGKPKKGHSFSVAEDDWTKTIPSPGHYEATVVRASIHPKSNVTYLKIEYSIQNGDGLRLALDELLPLDADPHDALYSRSAQGKSRVKAIMEANSRPLTFATVHEVPKALIGCRAIITVAHKNIDGLPVPIVKGIVGPAEPVKAKP